MTIDSFIGRVFEIAIASMQVKKRRPGLSICFNKKSNKWLDEGHVRALYPAALDPRMTNSEINRMIESTAPGRPCTHVGMRSILRQIQAEQVPVT